MEAKSQQPPVASNGKHDDLETPLLQSEGRDDGRISSLAQLVEEAKKQGALGMPVAAMGVISYILYSVSLAFVGRLGAQSFAASAMATSFASAFGFAILDGLSAGMETLGGQAHGAGQDKLLGLVLQRGIFVLLMACVPLSILLCFATPILLFLGQDPEIVALASSYAMTLIPGLIATACLSPLQKFLEVQGVTVPLAAAECIVLVLSVPLNYLCIFVFNWGYLGAAAAYSAAICLNVAILVLYLQFETSGILHKAWPGWSMAAFRDWSPFLRLAVPAMAMNCFEWWFFEFLVVMSGLLGNPEVSLSAMNITYQTCGVCYTVFMGLATAASVRVSNELGAQEAGKARRAVIVSIANALLAGSGLAVLMLVFRHKWALIYTTSEEVEVVETVAALMPLLIFSQLLLSVSAVMSGVLRGSGQQVAGSIVNGLSLWALAFPICYYLAFHEKQGLEGLWLGLIAGVGLQAVMNLGLAWRTDWNAQAVKALQRVS